MDNYRLKADNDNVRSEITCLWKESNAFYDLYCVSNGTLFCYKFWRHHFVVKKQAVNWQKN